MTPAEALANLLEELRLCPNRPRGGRLEAAEVAARQALGIEPAELPERVPRWETIDYPAADGYGPFEMVRAVCEPEGYCKDGHRCGQLDLGIRRDSQLNTTNDFAIFAEEFAEIHGQGITAYDTVYEPEGGDGD